MMDKKDFKSREQVIQELEAWEEMMGLSEQMHDKVGHLLTKAIVQIEAAKALKGGQG